MRKALIGVLLVATAATPLWAAPGERVRTAEQNGDEGDYRPQRAERQAQRVDRQEQRVERQVQRQQAVQQQPQQQQQSWRGRSDGGNQGSWQGRRGGGDGSAQTQQTQQSWRQRGGDGSAQTQQSWRDRRGGDRDGGGREGYRRHIDETRAASAASAAEGSPELQRRAAENQARYERSLRENRRDGHHDGRDWDRHGRRDHHRDLHRDYREEHRDLHRDDPTRGEHRRFHRDVRRDHRDYHGWDRSWRNDRRYDWQRHRYSNSHIFRRGGYYAPYRNHRYNRLSIGLILGSAFFGQNYWINDPWYYRLPPAYPGTRWVRYYDDVLLIDVYTGEVIDVIHDFFW